MCPIVNYVLVSLWNIVMMENNWELERSWCKIGYLRNLCLGSLISLRNSSVLGMSIWISIFKWIRNEDSKFTINCAMEQTLQYSLIPPFFWATLYALGLHQVSSVVLLEIFVSEHLQVTQWGVWGQCSLAHKTPQTPHGIWGEEITVIDLQWL